MTNADGLGLYCVNVDKAYEYLENISELQLDANRDMPTFKLMIPQLIESHANHLLTGQSSSLASTLQAFFVEEYASKHADHVHDMLIDVIGTLAFEVGEEPYDVRFDPYALGLVIRTTRSQLLVDSDDG